MKTTSQKTTPCASNGQAATCTALEGVLIGTAVGDSLGLPMEGLSSRRQRKLFPPPLRHRLLGRHGMVSDDTEHTFMLAQSLLDAPGSPEAFQRCLARRLRWWLFALPAGVGLATLRAIIKLWLGFSPNRSGVFSAGNGPAMRSALLGVFFADAPESRRQFVRASTELTHTDPRAETAALAVAETAKWMAGQSEDTEQILEILRHLASDGEWSALHSKLRHALLGNQSVGVFAEQIGADHGVSGYAYQTVPVAIYAALLHRNDFATALTEVIACGGDTDTVAAITGALVGARVGANRIPQAWRDGITEYPLTLKSLRQVARRLAEPSEPQTRLGSVKYFWPAIPLRNVVFLGIVLAHGFRRLLPPY